MAIPDLSSGLRVDALFSIALCSRCGLGITVPPPYRDTGDCPEYRNPGAAHADPARRAEFLRYARFSLSFFGPPATLRGKALLDIGCGGGESLLLGRKLGMAVRGVEVNPHQRAALASEGIRVEESLERLRGETFDCVILSHILEHLPDPLAVLSEIRTVLGCGARLLISVPNFGSFLARTLGKHWVGLQVRQHLWHFTPGALTRLVETAGYAVDRVELHALGMGLGEDGEPWYAGGGFLLDPQDRHFVGVMQYLLYFADLALWGLPGRRIRMFAEKRGGDNLFLVATDPNRSVAMPGRKDEGEGRT